jgi:adenylate cyclase
MRKHREIERKFLVKTLPPGWKCHPHSRITQGYFLMGNKDIEIRLRKKDSRRFITIKAGHGSNRLEEEIPIPEQQFRKLWPLTRDARISKTRYKIPYSGRTIEMDIYDAPRRGLITADIEFNSRQQARRRFRPPPWFGREITGDPRYSNQRLARKPIKSKSLQKR